MFSGRQKKKVRVQTDGNERIKYMEEEEVLLLWSFPGNAPSLVLLVKSGWW